MENSSEGSSEFTTLWIGDTSSPIFPEPRVFVVESTKTLSPSAAERLASIFAATPNDGDSIEGSYVGPRKEIVSPSSTNATDIAHSIGLNEITRIEEFSAVSNGDASHVDFMTQDVYKGLNKDSLVVKGVPEAPLSIRDIASYNDKMGLALSPDEIEYLEGISREIGRPLTDTEVYGFAQVNSEHCRHKIFTGVFIIGGKKKEKSLFQMIKETSRGRDDLIVSAYKDNVAFLKGPKLNQFAPKKADVPSSYEIKKIDSVLSLKAETHNYPTTVEPFSGASTGSGGEIRDRMAGGQGSVPLVGTAVYMTSYPRLKTNRQKAWENALPARKWLYQSPAEILVKASNGASDFGNKFGQPLINGSLLTFEGESPRATYAFDRVIMLAGGVGYANAKHAQKLLPEPGDKIIVLGGDNYRIGMGGASVSSVSTGEYSKHLELTAVQRANAEMQKRVYNVIRGLIECGENPIKIIHDHGAGGHMNCLTELVDPSGGRIQIRALPVGDSTLSLREIICNESQERMAILVRHEAVALVQTISAREKAPCYVVGEINASGRLVFENSDGYKAIDLALKALLDHSPKTVLEDEEIAIEAKPISFSPKNGAEILEALKDVLSLEGVASKDWLTNKVDRCVTGKVAAQPCVGKFQLTLGNVGVVALDYSSKRGIATSIGHAPSAGIIDERAASTLSIAEALTNLVWAPLERGLDSVALSANWMWPAKRPGENARLYNAVEALANAAKALGVPVPTGKDSLSMSMKYDDGSEVRSPGTVIISAAAEVSNISQVVTPDLKPEDRSVLIYVNLSSQEENHLGGSALAQVLAQTGDAVPNVSNLQKFREGFNLIQKLIIEGQILAGHDVSSGGVITSLCEMAFGGDMGIRVETPTISDAELPAFLFCEKPSVLLQVESKESAKTIRSFQNAGIEAFQIASLIKKNEIEVKSKQYGWTESVSVLRRVWLKPSEALDMLQTVPALAKERGENFDKFPLNYVFPAGFTGIAKDYGIELERQKTGPVKAAVIRDKGTNGEREMAFALFAAGFDVRDVAMTDLVEGRETLEDVNFAIFPGGFSNSDVLGAGRGWAAAFQYNENAYHTIDRFLKRHDTLSLGVCNGCQLMTALNLVYPEHPKKVEMLRNASKKFESTFVCVNIQDTNSIMLKDLIGCRLGIWIAHGEGRFYLPEGEDAYNIPIKFVTSKYPANPNSSPFNAAAICSHDGRHLAMMPHLERSSLPWNWPYYPWDLKERHEISPWILAFVTARKWIEGS